MKRTYLAMSSLALAAVLLPPATVPQPGLAGTFSSTPLDASKLAVLARPVGQSDWNLLVLEQLKPEPLCWQTRSDGLIDPVLNRFDFSGICGRFLDSNGYSLRAASEDHGGRYRLRLQQVGEEVLLQAFSPDQPTMLLLGRGQVPLRDREGFVAIKLEAGWELERRSFGSTSLNHVYFAHATPLPVLISQANPASSSPPLPLKTPPPIPIASTAGAAGESSFGPASLRAGGDLGSGPIALQVIPYQGQGR
ncbi:MAG: DUF3747 domain-containing protein [Prochlorococcaceae cyanobacterium]